MLSKTFISAHFICLGRYETALYRKKPFIIIEFVIVYISPPSPKMFKWIRLLYLLFSKGLGEGLLRVNVDMMAHTDNSWLMTGHIFKVTDIPTRTYFKVTILPPLMVTWLHLSIWQLACMYGHLHYPVVMWWWFTYFFARNWRLLLISSNSWCIANNGFP